MKRSALGAAIVAAAVVTLAAQEPVNDAVIAQIKTEGFQHSQVMDTLSWLSDVAGPRLTGSPELRKAGEWARDQMTKWGLERAALEPYGSVGRGWVLERFDLEMTEPQWMRIIGYPRAFSAPTRGPIVGTPVLVEIASKDDFEKYKGKLRGAIVMNGRPAVDDIGFEPEAKRLTGDDLRKRAGAIEPAPSGNDDARTRKSGPPASTEATVK